MLTPIDIENKDFKKALRGYKEEEVDEQQARHAAEEIGDDAAERGQRADAARATEHEHQTEHERHRARGERDRNRAAETL